jgi:hypothetical protein
MYSAKRVYNTDLLHNESIQLQILQKTILNRGKTCKTHQKITRQLRQLPLQISDNCHNCRQPYKSCRQLRQRRQLRRQLRQLRQ